MVTKVAQLISNIELPLSVRLNQQAIDMCINVTSLVGDSGAVFTMETARNSE